MLKFGIPSLKCSVQGYGLRGWTLLCVSFGQKRAITQLKKVWMACRVLLHLLTLKDNEQMYLLYLNLWGFWAVIAVSDCGLAGKEFQTSVPPATICNNAFQQTEIQISEAHKHPIPSLRRGHRSFMLSSWKWWIQPPALYSHLPLSKRAANPVLHCGVTPVQKAVTQRSLFMLPAASY